MSAKVNARIRMYRMGELGDCFLVTFTAGSEVSNLLIDCGSFRNGGPSVKQVKEVVTKGIMKDLGGRPLDVVVGTHQHNDHLSGFVHCESEFKSIGVNQVWLSWLDSPRDKKAQRIGETYNNLTKHLTVARDNLKKGMRGASPQSVHALSVLEDILGFYGAAAKTPAGAKAPPATPADAVKILKQISGKEPDYLRPGESLDLPGMPADSVRVHVLGPPRTDHVDKKGDPLFRKDPREGESYDHSLAAFQLQASRFMAASRGGAGADASRDERNYPFKHEYKKTAKQAAGSPPAAVVKNYQASDAKWRRIDDDWMQQAESLALFLDTFTNNSSLVLAIELVASGKVLFFAADAQTGNQASWADVKWKDKKVTTDSLLERTVFYKVGHHASHNATLPAMFEKMTSKELVAFIPVDKSDPNITKRGGWKMPAKNLFKKLVANTDHRVLQMDDKNPPACDPKKDPAKKAWARIGVKPVVTPLAVEIEIKG